MSPEHPLDRPDLAGRFAGLRLISAGMILGMVMVATLIAMVVHFALDGQPLAGNGVRIGGLSVLSWGALFVAATAPVVALVVSARATAAGLAKLPTADVDGIVGVLATATFIEFAVTEAAGVLCALLYHVTADPLMLGCVAALAGFLVLRFPSPTRTKSWYDAAEATIGQRTQ
jgi:hypothetical protein